jgi:hypothetical protein
VGPVRTSRGYYVLKVTDKKPADAALWATRGEDFRAKLEEQRRQQLTTEWYRQLISAAAIENNIGTYLRTSVMGTAEKKTDHEAPLGGLYY